MSKIIDRNVRFLNEVRAVLTPAFQDRIPQASRDTLEAIGHMMLDPANGNVMNEWLTSILNKIGKTIIHSAKARNKLERFWRGDMAWGDIIEEIGIDIPVAQTYLQGKQYEDGSTQGDLSRIAKCEPNPYCKEPQENVTHYHRRNRQEFYKRTIWRKTLMKAFTGQAGFNTIITEIIQSLYTANRADQYLYAKEILAQYINNPAMALTPAQVVTLTNHIVDNDTGKEFLTQLKIKSELMAFNSRNFNPVGITTYTDPSEMILLIRADMTAILDVETLVGAFNPEYLNNKVSSVITLDDFGTDSWTGLTPSDVQYKDDSGEGIVAMLIDKDMLAFYQNSQEFSSKYNEEGRYWNYWLHIDETYTASYFKNAIIFKQ